MIPIVLLMSSIALGLLAYILYEWSTHRHNYFENRGIKYIKPYPIIGNSTWMIKNTNLSDFYKSIYNLFPNEKIIGIFHGRQPGYLIRDPQLIKHFSIKDFDYFTDRIHFMSPEDDEIFGNMLPQMKGQQWKNMRNTLSPLFTGNKMRQMFQLMINCCESLRSYITEEFQQHDPQYHWDMKDLFMKYSNDVIAACAFGVQCNSFTDPDNDFVQISRAVLNMASPLQRLKIFLIRIAPKLTASHNIRIMDHKYKKIFHKLIFNTIEMRQQEKIFRPDILNLFMEFKAESRINNDKNEGMTQFSDAELMAQCFSFFLGGYDNISTVLSFLSYELAVNRNVQDNVLKEIDYLSSKLNGSPLTYEGLNSLNYLDMTVSEVLRKWWPSDVINRVCVKDYTFRDGDGIEFQIEKGMPIYFPIYAIHRDPKYFPDPECFEPERFSQYNSVTNNTEAYFPFGVGPRHCIGK